MGFRFKFSADHFLLDRVKALCVTRGLDYNRFVEFAILDAFADLQLRRANGRKRLASRNTSIETDNPDIEELARRLENIDFRVNWRFDRLLGQKIERRLALCEAGLLSSP